MSAAGVSSILQARSSPQHGVDFYNLSNAQMHHRDSYQKLLQGQSVLAAQVHHLPSNGPVMHSCSAAANQRDQLSNYQVSARLQCTH